MGSRYAAAACPAPGPDRTTEDCPRTALTGGEAEISGTFTQDSAVNLAANVSSGALPVDLTVTEVTVRP